MTVQAVPLDMVDEPINSHKGKGKAIPESLLLAWTGSEGSRKLRLPDFKIVFT
jgi:hypothetical protein